LLGIVLFFNRLCFGFDDEGFQIWSTPGTSFELNKDWKADVQQEFRLGDDGGNLYYEHTDIGFKYQGLANRLDVGLNYRHIQEKSNGRWRKEYRPHFNLTLKGRLLNFGLINRSRFEFREREGKSDMWRYRNKFTIKFPVALTALKLKPFLADEVFIEMSDRGYHRNRLYSGVSLNLLEDVDGKVYYLWQSTRAVGGRSDIYVFGAAVNVRF